MNWKKKLTSRKFWMALAAFVAGLLALFQVDANTVQQISGVVMSLGAVIAYIVGEGLIDSASAGASVTINGDAALAPTGEVVNTDVPATANTGAGQAAQVKQNTALSPESGAVASDTTGAV